MKLLSYKEEHGMLFLFTDDPDYPDFAYPIDRFADAESLLKEMNRKRTEIEAKKAAADLRKENLKAQLDIEIEKGKV